MDYRNSSLLHANIFSFRQHIPLSRSLSGSLSRFKDTTSLLQTNKLCTKHKSNPERKRVSSENQVWSFFFVCFLFCFVLEGAPVTTFLSVAFVGTFFTAWASAEYLGRMCIAARGEEGKLCI